MFRYVLKRLALMVLTLFGITVLTFVLTRLTPGDPAAMKIRGGAGGQASGGYDDMLELNRRNLGLDKPLLLNLRFEDGEASANAAITDLFRNADFWTQDGERRLIRQSTVAAEAALRRYEAIGSADEPLPRRATNKALVYAPDDVRRARLAKLLPTLMAAQDPAAPTAPEEAFRFWKAWLEAHRTRFERGHVKEVVARALKSRDDAAAAEVTELGGFAVEPLIEAMGAADAETVRFINRCLERQTGFTFSQEKDADLAPRWRSWWRREKIQFQHPSAATHAINIFRNTQFGLWMSQAITLDFGDSYSKRRPVLELVGRALPVSLIVGGLSIVISYLIAIPLGIFSAIKRRTAADRVVTLILFILYSMPSFWVAGLLLLTTTGKPFLSLFPARGLHSDGLEWGAAGVSNFAIMADYLWHLVLPVTVLTYGSLAFISRQMRSAMLETLHQDYIRTARAKGLGWRSVVFKHALRNSLIPVLTISAGLLPELIAGAVITESIFTIPGMGTMTFEAIVNRDYPVINAVLFFSAFLTLLGILLADLSYALADPRITYE